MAAHAGRPGRRSPLGGLPAVVHGPLHAGAELEVRRGLDGAADVLLLGGTACLTLLV